MLLYQLKKSLSAEADFIGGSGSIEIPTGQSLMEKPLLEFGSCPEKIIGMIRRSGCLRIDLWGKMFLSDETIISGKHQTSLYLILKLSHVSRP